MEKPQTDELFELPRKLELKAQPIATSSDPMLAYLERKGWQLHRIHELLKTISLKSQPNIFGPQDKLTRPEWELIGDIDAFTESIREVEYET